MAALSALLKLALRYLLLAATALQLSRLSDALFSKGGWYSPTSGKHKGSHVYMVPALAVVPGLGTNVLEAAKECSGRHLQALSDDPSISRGDRKTAKQQEGLKLATLYNSNLSDMGAVVSNMFEEEVPGLETKTLQCFSNRKDTVCTKRSSINELEEAVLALCPVPAQPGQVSLQPVSRRPDSHPATPTYAPS
jgi:hypothetical protein